MIKNYLKIAIRSLLKNKLFSLINVSGLTIGMVSFVLIMLYVNYEKSYDKFYPNADRIQRVYMDYLEGDQYEAGDAQTYNPTGSMLKENFPEIESYVRFFQLVNVSFIYKENIQKVANGLLADSTYFKVFDHELLIGNKDEALVKPNAVVLSEKLAKKLFGGVAVLGKTLDFYHPEKQKLTVTGVMKDIPDNTHIKADYLVSYNTAKTWNYNLTELTWNNNTFFTYLLIKKGVDIDALRSKIMAFDDGVENERHNIEPLTDIHLHSDKPYEAQENGSAARVKFLLAMAIVIVVLSWLNFINLSVSRSMERALETGVRKASGASKMQLVHQFLLESTIINLMAMVLASIIIYLSLPLFNAFTGKDLALGILSIFFYVRLFIAIIMGAFISGFLPALLLANINPSLILKGKNRKKQSYVYAQKSLVISQIVATIVLLILTIVINKQLHFIQNKHLGFSNEQIIALTGEDYQNLEWEAYKEKFFLLKNNLDKIPEVERTAYSQSYPGEGYMNMSCSIGFGGPDGEKYERGLYYHYRFNEDYIPLMGFKLLAGRNFEQHDEGKRVIIINEAMAQSMGYSKAKDIVGKFMKIYKEDTEIIGVLKNHNFFGFKSKEPSFVYSYDNNADGGLLVKLNANANTSINQLIANVEQEWYTVFKKSSFSYVFIDEQFSRYFAEEQLFNKAFSLFTLLAIFIASLGMFGLGTQICSQRTKEVGVRKVNGAKAVEVVAMLNKEFVQWVVSAFVIAAPIAYYLVDNWLQNFAYKTTISWWIFIMAGMSALTIALLTVSFQTFKAARRNPIDSLRYE